MSDNTSGDNGARIFNFPRIGFQLTPTTTLPGPPVPPPPATPPTPAQASLTPPRPGSRRSPLDTLAALPDPGLLAPVITTPTPQTGTVPDTFRNEPAPDMVGPRLGALSLAAILAVAVAALRGTHTVLSTWWENRQARAAETADLREARVKQQLASQEQAAKHSSAMQTIGDKASQQRAKHNRIPSSHEFGRKTLGGRGGGTGGTSGKGTGSGGKSGGSGTSRNRSGGLLSNGGGKGKGGGTHNHRTPKNTPTTPGPPKSPNKPKAPHRPSQGAGGGLDKHKRTNNRADRKGKHSADQRGGLRGALGDTARRLNKRRRNLDKPSLGGSDHTARRDLKKKRLKGGDTSTHDSSKKTPTSPKTPDSKTRRTMKDRKGPSLTDAIGRTTHKAARKRLKRRRRTMTPPIWSAARTRKDAKDSRTKTPKHGATKDGGSTSKGPKPGKTRTNTGGGQYQRIWDKARAYARKNTAAGDFFGGDTTPGGRPGSQSGPSHGTSGNPGHGTRGGRRSPFENAGHAAGHGAWKVERDDYPGAQAKRWQPDAITAGSPALPRTGPAALDAAPTPHTARPGTTRPKEPIAMPPAPVPAARDPRIRKAKNQAARTAHSVAAASRHMDAQHETEITLDDAIDEYGDFKDDAFKTHDQCSKLADRARRLRDTLIVFADDLATNHNLIGPLFTGAMARMAESMDLVARMADEMQISSLQAAEMAEAADNDLNDTYRPYTTATADAGLTTPSAPIHNET